LEQFAVHSLPLVRQHGRRDAEEDADFGEHEAHFHEHADLVFRMVEPVTVGMELLGEARVGRLAGHLNLLPVPIIQGASLGGLLVNSEGHGGVQLRRRSGDDGLAQPFIVLYLVFQASDFLLVGGNQLFVVVLMLAQYRVFLFLYRQCQQVLFVVHLLRFVLFMQAPVAVQQAQKAQQQQNGQSAIEQPGLECLFLLFVCLAQNAVILVAGGHSGCSLSV